MRDPQDEFKEETEKLLSMVEGVSRANVRRELLVRFACAALGSVDRDDAYEDKAEEAYMVALRLVERMDENGEL